MVVGGVVSNTDKTTFSSDTTARIPGANLSVARFRMAGAHNAEKGYFGAVKILLEEVHQLIN